MAARREHSKSEAKSQQVQLSKCLPPLVLAWLIPGAGHYYLRRRRHAAVLLVTIPGMFMLGILMQGRMFEPSNSDLFTTVMTYGGYIADLCTGLLYFLTVGLGYHQETLPGAVHDYGTKFIACAGLLNILAMVDTYEIASGKKAAA